LLAALTLIVATCWLISKRRPVWYTLLPALFMLTTSVWMLIRELVWKFVPAWSTSKPLAITTIVVLAMTAGIVASAIRRWTRRDVSGAVTVSE
jgi:carbon starvation protein CstA